MTQAANYPSLQGKRVFVTGGGTGIGASIVEAFAKQGARVAFVDIAKEASEALCNAVAASGAERPLFRACDITDIASLQSTMKEFAAELGDFDVLVNNAANDQRHSVEDVTPEYWDQRIAINQRPLFFTCQAVLPGMKAKGGGSIINIGSISWIAKGAGYPVYARPGQAQCARQHGYAGLGHDPASGGPVGRRCGGRRDRPQPVPAGQAAAGTHRCHVPVPGRR
jgi:NAD(P)-dependent dehydrogenase (short-subunit alcohol dehydrogenase family)